MRFEHIKPYKSFLLHSYQEALRMQIICDFDGVFTDQTEHVRLYTDLMISEIERITGKDWPEIQQEIDEELHLPHSNPTAHGWKPLGTLSSYWNESDSFTATAIFENLLNRRYQEVVEQHHPSIYKCLDKFFKQAYAETKPKMDQGIEAMFEKFKEQGVGLTIVTTSAEESTRALLNNNEVPIVGKALKFAHNPEFTTYGTDVSVQHNKTTYIVNVQRDKYHDIIKQAEEKHGSVDLVVGDVFSLDLSLPYAMGKEIVLKKNDYTPAWAEKFVERCGRGHVIHGLEELPVLCEKIRKR